MQTFYTGITRREPTPALGLWITMQSEEGLASVLSYWPVRNSVRGDASTCTGFFQCWTYWLGDQLGSIKWNLSSWCLWSVLMRDNKRQTIIPLILNIKHERVALKCLKRNELIESFWSEGISSRRLGPGMCLTWCSSYILNNRGWIISLKENEHTAGVNTETAINVCRLIFLGEGLEWLAAISGFCF